MIVKRRKGKVVKSRKKHRGMPDSIPIVGKLKGLTVQNPLILAIFLWQTLFNPMLTTAIQPLFIALNIYSAQDVIKPKKISAHPRRVLFL
jgi:hypothetical protein